MALQSRMVTFTPTSPPDRAAPAASVPPEPPESRTSPASRTVPIAIQPAPQRSQRPPPTQGPWRFGTLLASPHRLGFFLAAVVLVMASLWWLAVQWGRITGAFALGGAVPPTLTHAAVMVFGFMPLYFSGFLFTAGPKWLNVPPYAARQLLESGQQSVTNIAFDCGFSSSQYFATCYKKRFGFSPMETPRQRDAAVASSRW